MSIKSLPFLSSTRGREPLSVLNETIAHFYMIQASKPVFKKNVESDQNSMLSFFSEGRLEAPLRWRFNDIIILYSDYMIPRIERSEKKFSPQSNIRCCKFTEPEAIFLKKLDYWICNKGMVGCVISAVTKPERKSFDNQNQLSIRIDRILDKSFASIKFMLPFVHKSQKQKVALVLW